MRKIKLGIKIEAAPRRVVPRRNLSRLAVKYCRGKWAAGGRTFGTNRILEFEERKKRRKKRKKESYFSGERRSNAFPLCTAMYLVRIMLLGNLSVF